MAYAQTYATSAGAALKYGSKANATAVAGIVTYAEMAEGVINTITRFNWSTGYASADDYVKGILQDAATNLMAIYVISYDMSGYGRSIAETMIDVLYNGFTRDIEILKLQATQDFYAAA